MFLPTQSLSPSLFLSPFPALSLSPSHLPSSPCPCPHLVFIPVPIPSLVPIPLPSSSPSRLCLHPVPVLISSSSLSPAQSLSPPIFIPVPSPPLFLSLSSSCTHSCPHPHPHPCLHPIPFITFPAPVLVPILFPSQSLSLTSSPCCLHPCPHLSVPNRPCPHPHHCSHCHLISAPILFPTLLPILFPSPSLSLPPAPAHLEAVPVCPPVALCSVPHGRIEFAPPVSLVLILFLPLRSLVGSRVRRGGVAPVPLEAPFPCPPCLQPPSQR